MLPACPASSTPPRPLEPKLVRAISSTPRSDRDAVGREVHHRPREDDDARVRGDVPGRVTAKTYEFDCRRRADLRAFAVIEDDRLGKREPEQVRVGAIELVTSWPN
jgi:hypothetical protein